MFVIIVELSLMYSCTLLLNMMAIKFYNDSNHLIKLLHNACYLKTIKSCNDCLACICVFFLCFLMIKLQALKKPDERQVFMIELTLNFDNYHLDRRELKLGL